MATGSEVAFSEFLLSESHISDTFLRQAQKVSSESDDSLARSIAKLGFIPESLLADLLARFGALPRLPRPISIRKAIEPLSIEFLKRNALIPLEEESEQVPVAVADPLNANAVRGLEFALERAPLLYVATFSEVETALVNLEETLSPSPDPYPPDSELSIEALKDIASDAPVIRLVQRLITMAIDRKASDIHMEAGDASFRIRFRLDGVLSDIESLPLSYASHVVSRIKVMARLNIAERRLPQDGRLHVTINGKGIDFRVATVPTLHGENLVLRILDREEVELSFERLGFDATCHGVMLEALRKPYGIILSTGPTGSGKTTTLYTALKELNQPERKILTVEDPVEYALTGVNQTQIKPAIGYTFAAALRAFLRQDPDVIMVGEIRDRETADVAIQAALTGHLLLSTLHTNSAAGAVSRLLDMGIDDFLLTSTINLLIGQRLVRKLCSACRVSYSPAMELCERLCITGEGSYFRAAGCPSCGGTGYAGRSGLLELLELSDPVRQAILSRADTASIENEAVKAGMRTMFRHGLELAAQGVTTVEEVLRVTRAAS